MQPKIVKKQTAQETQSPEDLAKLQDYAKNLMQQAKEYNDTYLDIPEIYKTFEPSPSMILVRLKLSPHPNYEVIGFEKETNAAKGQLMNYWANEEHRKGYGVVVAGSLPFGTNVIVSPMAFYQANFLISEEHSFTSPVHTLPGFFLIPKNLVLGTYKDETKTVSE